MVTMLLNLLARQNVEILEKAGMRPIFFWSRHSHIREFSVSQPHKSHKTINSLCYKELKVSRTKFCHLEPEQLPVVRGFKQMLHKKKFVERHQQNQEFTLFA